MATRSEELRALAQAVADGLPEFVTDVVLTGSVSRGVADGASDVELLVVSDELPPLEVCIAAPGLESVDTWVPPIAGAYWLGGRKYGEFVEFVWWTRSHTDGRVAAIAAGEIVDHHRLKTAEAITNGVSLRGSAHAYWSRSLSSYPPGLAERIVADVALAWIDTPSQLQGLYRPGDGVVLADFVVGRGESILRLVFALNREWEPGWKRLAARVATLRVKPDDLAERLDAAVRALDLACMRGLAKEALELAPPLPEVRHALEALAEPL